MTDSNPVPVLTLDGPSGSGKGTVGAQLAARLGWHFLESGALYRGVALAAKRAGIHETDTAGLAQVARESDIQFERRPGIPARILLNGLDVSEAIRAEEISRLASRIAALPAVRQALLAAQHALRQVPGLVADGRDMGTAVFPDAVLKIFLTASSQARAERRYKQLKDKGFDVNLPRLAEEIDARDARDEKREVSPLKPANDACIVDTSSLTIPQVVGQILRQLRDRLGK